MVMNIEMVSRRDGVSESQFNQVLNIELDQIIEVHFINFIFLSLI